MTLAWLAALLLLILDSSAAQLPQCPNGQPPKRDNIGRLIQCLPGSSQRVVCGMEHACFFTGMNYVCCPSNEPTPDNQPSCQKPYLTVLGSNGMPLQCSPRTRSCPSPSMVCSDTGHHYICCEKTSEVTEKPKEKPREKPVQKPREVEQTPRWEDELECPSNALGVLNDRGEKVICNSRKRCPGRQQFCYGGLKRSICCERYETASDFLNQKSSESTNKNKRVLKKKKKTKLRQVSIDSNAQLSTTTERPVIRANSFVSDQIQYMPKSISIAMKPSRKVLKQVKLNEGSSATSVMRAIEQSSEQSRTEFIEEDSDFEQPRPTKVKKNHMEQLNSNERIRDRSFEVARPATRRSTTQRTTPTTTEATTTTERTTTTEEMTEEPTTTAMTTQRTTTEREEFTDEPFRARARVHASKTIEMPQKAMEMEDADLVQADTEFAVSNPEVTAGSSPSTSFAESKQMPMSETMPQEDKRQLAQTFLMQQIRDGWPYNDKFYMPTQ